ncbi:AAA family ATPase [Oscillatoriales cyanobacterium LEGE 11467]|uniref:AAA family ATPase n=1 Tax=Zarconia navalis LEGE 11467 TaxID=1828826 RepID=A0A928Z5V6_9CYAN|nr:AAA family ATPase [Zarconia navalis]MBE9039712.1 AAA family ATPase [Zarconia navalis LEGE 11467]
MPTFPTYRGNLPKCLNPFNWQHLCLLAYWIYFRPTALKCYCYQAAPDLYRQDSGEAIFRTFRVAAFRNLYLAVIWATFLLSIIIGFPILLILKYILLNEIHPTQNILSWFLGTLIGNSTGLLFFISFLLVFGITVGVSRGLMGVILCMTVGVAKGILIGVLCGISGIPNLAEFLTSASSSMLVGAAMGTVVGITVGITIGGLLGWIVGGLFGSASFGITAFSFVIIGEAIKVIEADEARISLPFGIVFSITLGLVASGTVGTSLSFLRALMASTAINFAIGLTLAINEYLPTSSEEIWTGWQIWILSVTLSCFGSLRVVPFLFPIHLFFVGSYRWFRKLKHPIEWDELSILPLPGTQELLIKRLCQDELSGLHFLSDLARNPFRRRVVQQALKKHLQDHNLPLNFLYLLLTDSSTQEYACVPITQEGWEKLPSVKQLLLGELSEQWVDCTVDRTSHLLEYLVYGLTLWGRDRRDTPLTRFARILYELLYETQIEDKNFKLSKFQWAYKNLAEYVGGSEIERSFEAMDNCLSYDRLSEIAQVVETVSELPDRETAIRPKVICALDRLRTIAEEVKIYLAATSPRNQQAALLRANNALNTLDEYIDSQIVTPEKAILRRIVRQWYKLVSEEGGKVARNEGFQPISNPYTTYNPVTGSLFVGRDKILQRLDELWRGSQQRSSVVLYGHRRMGKSSILRNLEHRFGSRTIVVNFDMQLVGVVKSTGELLYVLAIALYDKLYDHLSPIQQQELEEPQEESFTDRNPYQTFKRFIQHLDSVRQEQVFIVTVDEFERLEEMFDSHIIDPHLLHFWRGLFQTYSWFVMAFAGVHKLEEMCRDYWYPLFENIERIKVSFLDRHSARQLIEQPTPDFELDYTPDAVEKIIFLTNGQPHLIQLICHVTVTYYNRNLPNLDNRRDKLLTARDVDRAIDSPEFQQNGSVYFEGIWGWVKTSQPDGQIKILRQLCHQKLTVNELVNRTKLNPSQISIALQKLESCEVLKKENFHYLFSVELMRQWVKNKNK